jgi:CubicO group peptidase (beta-lactamase class C family)
MVVHPTLRSILPALIAATILQAPSLAAQTGGRNTTLTTGVPADVGMSARALDSAVALYRDAVQQGELVGAVVLVARHGKVVVYEAIGARHHEAGLPMDKGTMFRMASNTKPVVATAIAILAERGKLRFDDPVMKHIPVFDNKNARDITIAHLLSHTAGFRINSLFAGKPMTKSKEHPDAPNLRLEVDRIGKVGAKEKPGATYAYSNPGYNTLGAIIEVVSGQPLEVFLRENIYSKLGMPDSYHLEIADKLDGKLQRMGAVYYARDKKTGKWEAGWKPGDPAAVPFVRASGGMISTAWDYAIFLQTHLNGGTYGNVRLLGPESVKLMTTRHSPPGETSYGYGWGLTADRFGHSGSDGTYAWVDPTRDIIGLVFTQTPSGKNPTARFREMVSAAVEQERPRRSSLP